MCNLENKTIHFNMNCRVKNVICGTHNTHGRNKYISAGSPIKNKLTPNRKTLLNRQGIKYLKPIDVTQENAGFNNSGTSLRTTPFFT